MKFPLDPQARGEVLRLAGQNERSGGLIRDLLARVEKLEHDHLNWWMCSHCGATFPREADHPGDAQRHMASCLKHPLRRIEQEEQALASCLAEAVDVLADVAAEDILQHRRQGFWSIEGSKGRDVLDRAQALLARLKTQVPKPQGQAHANGKAEGRLAGAGI